MAKNAEEQRDAVRLIAEARVKTGDFIARLMLTYAAFAAFCVFALLSPDRLMILPQASVNMPFAGNVSFLAFMLVAPAVLIVMRVYLEVYVHRWRLLDRELTPESEPKTVSPLKHPLLRVFSAIVLYPLLPAILFLFVWKAAAGFIWVDAILGVAVACLVAQVARLMPWPSHVRWAMCVIGIFVGGGFAAYVVVPHRGLDLSREDLSGAILRRQDLSDANLSDANLQRAKLTWANLQEANLTGANLQGAILDGALLQSANLQKAQVQGAKFVFASLQLAKLGEANLQEANLGGANLRGANLIYTDLSRADLSKANLRGANLGVATLSGAKHVKQEQLDSACYAELFGPPKLDEGLKPPPAKPSNECPSPKTSSD
jgi:hypothetical protein